MKYGGILFYLYYMEMIFFLYTGKKGVFCGLTIFKTANSNYKFISCKLIASWDNFLSQII